MGHSCVDRTPISGESLRKPALASLSRRQLVSMGLGALAGAEIASIPVAYAASQPRTLCWFTAHGTVDGVGGASPIA